MSKFELLIHPVRIRVVEALSGRPMTTRELHDALGDVPIATLYRHVDRLVDGGIVAVVAERRVRGGVERTLAVDDESASLGPADIESPAQVEQAFRTFIGALLSRADRLFSAHGDEIPRQIGFRHIPVWLTDEEYDELADRISAAFSPVLANTEDGRNRHVITLISLPET